jgi:hypothetical protein
VAHPEAVSWTAPRPRSSLELGPDRQRVALAADEEPSRLIDTRCPVGLEALPYVLSVAGEHQGRPRLTVPMPIATAPGSVPRCTCACCDCPRSDWGRWSACGSWSRPRAIRGLAWGVVKLS